LQITKILDLNAIIWHAPKRGKNFLDRNLMQMQKIEEYYTNKPKKLEKTERLQTLYESQLSTIS
jgi:hypothetical protein